MLKEILAVVATLLVVTSYIPQMIKGYRTKSLRDISMLFLVIILLGVFTWAIYGVVAGDMILLAANSIIFLFALSLIGMKLYYEKGKL